MIQHDCHRSTRVFVDVCDSDRITKVLDDKHVVLYSDRISFLFFFVIMASSWKIFRIVRRHQHQIKDQGMAVSHLQSKTMNILKSENQLPQCFVSTACF